MSWTPQRGIPTFATPSGPSWMGVIAPYVFFFFKRCLDAPFQGRSCAGVLFLTIRFPLGVVFVGNLFHGAAGFDRFIFALFRKRLRTRSGLQDQPLVFNFLAADADERPFALCFKQRANGRLSAS